MSTTSAAHWSSKTVFTMLAPPPVRSVQLLNHLCTQERLLSNSGTLVRLRYEKELHQTNKDVSGPDQRKPTDGLYWCEHAIKPGIKLDIVMDFEHLQVIQLSTVVLDRSIASVPQRIP